MCTTLVFGKAYNVCSRFPQGTRWEVFQRSRYSSCGWNMATFADALMYLRQQYRNAERHTKERRRPGDEHCVNEFHGWIDGPGGRMPWKQIEALVKAE